jgi:hypothetical protein
MGSEEEFKTIYAKTTVELKTNRVQLILKGAEDRDRAASIHRHLIYSVCSLLILPLHSSKTGLHRASRLGSVGQEFTAWKKLVHFSSQSNPKLNPNVRSL